jgi:hypothetical protein
MIWIPLLVFVSVCGMAYLAVVETAFGVLMRLPERLEAERESDADGLTSYLVADHENRTNVTDFLEKWLIHRTL